MTKLTIKQKKFADEYIISGNAYQSAIKAGYSENYAKGNVIKLLENVRVKKYINARLKEIEDKQIAKQDEILKYLTAVMRGEEKE
ncbi:MAG: terminase small subunit, partial [Helcococcus sp.]|nr:terminase small subunit [Helcococcus sp.]